MYQNLWGTEKEILKEEFIAINSKMKKKEKVLKWKSIAVPQGTRRSRTNQMQIEGKKW